MHTDENEDVSRPARCGHVGRGTGGRGRGLGKLAVSPLSPSAFVPTGIGRFERSRPSRAGGRRARRQQDVVGCIGRFQVAGNHGRDCGLNAATVERVCLDHKHRPAISRLRAAGFGEIRPPDVSPLNLAHLYQESLSRIAGPRAYTSFRRSVTALSCRGLRNSEIAVAYN